MLWWEKEEKTVVNDLHSDAIKGLTNSKADKLIKRYGANEFAAAKKVSPVTILLSQFADFMVMVLIAAAGLSFFIGERVDFYVILAIVLLNAILGFIQEYRAERSMEALLKLAAPDAKVTREGKIIKVPARQIVPGDLVLVEAGDRIPADMRLIEEYSLQANEALLTGESLPVSKCVRPLKSGLHGPADLKNMLFMGTTITRGRAKGIVVNTGIKTEMGKIAELIAHVKQEKTPLEQRLNELGKWLVAICGIICFMVSLTGWLRGENPYIMLMAGISLAVAAIPEGLPAIVTVALALGTRRMLSANALIRRLPAVETLGCTTVICSDKTGTLTENKMTVRRIYSLGTVYEINNHLVANMMKDSALLQTIKCGLVCNNAYLDEKSAQGDPTEIALLTLAKKVNMKNENIIVKEFPFDSTKKRMSVVLKDPTGEYSTYVKGALESLLPLCKFAVKEGKIVSITPAIKKIFLDTQNVFASNALRVIALAGKQGFANDEKQADSRLTLYGIIGMIDPPRAEAKLAVANAAQAGIRTIMITGDHPLTAQKIASELGIIANDQKVLTANELTTLSEQQRKDVVAKSCAFARVSPEDKLLIVKTLKQNGEVVAMTGDGVNDAPAVKEADIGVAMGITGSDVTKEAAGMVLLDDNYATIVRAVQEGRAIYDNIRKFLRYLLGCNTGEVITMFIAAIFALPLPLLPVQILWMNLVTDGLPAMALGVDNSNSELMQKAPRNPREGIFARGLAGKILIQGVSISAVTLIAYVLCLFLYQGNIELARTMAFTVLVMTQMTYVFICRSEQPRSFINMVSGNKYLITAVVVSLLMHIAVLYIPLFSKVFHTVPLNAFQWSLVLALNMIVILPFIRIRKKSLQNEGFCHKK